MQHPSIAFAAVALALPLAAPAIAQQSDALFDAPIVYIDEQAPPFTAVLDWNGDGYPDILGLSHRSDYASYRTAIYLNQGDGSVQQTWFEEVFSPSGVDYPGLQVASGDFNGDRREDFVLGGGDHTIVYRSERSGTPTKVSHDEGALVRGVGIADLDGDDGLDLLILLDETLRVRWNNGTQTDYALGALADTYVRLAVREQARGASPDVVLWSDEGLAVLTIGRTGFQQIGDFAISYDYPELDLGDVDGDGDQDIVVFGNYDTQYTVFRRSGPGSFVEENPATGGPATKLRDVNGDGRVDGVCCGGGGPTPTFGDNVRVSLFEIAINDGGGGFAPSFQFQGIGSWKLADVADMDLDGDADLIAGRNIYFARGPLEEAPTKRVDAGTLPLDKMYDVDRDGDVDFGVTLAQTIYNRGDGSVSVGTPVQELAPAGTSFTDVGYHLDADGDGDQDYVAEQWQGETFLGMRLLLNNGGGGFADGGATGPAGVFFQPSLFEKGTAISGDVDNDGDLDLFTRVENYNADFAARLFLNDGNGGFTESGDYSTLRPEHVADLDGDGINDLVYSFENGGPFYGNAWGLYVLRGTGNDAPDLFEPLGMRIPLYEGIFFNMHGAPPVIADFNADGHLDASLSISDGDDYHGHLALNTQGSTGSFGFELILPDGAPPLYTSVWNPGGIHSLDVDGDGLNDLVMNDVDRTPYSAAIFLRKPGTEGSFAPDAWEAPIVQVFAARQPVDADGDGDTDFVGTWFVKSVLFEAPADGACAQYGSGTAGLGSMVPNLGASGPFRIGEHPRILLSGAYGGSVSVLGVSLNEGSAPGFPIPDATTWFNPFAPGLIKIRIPLDGPFGIAGEGGFDVGVHVGPALVGNTFYHQAFVFDPSHPYSVTSSNGLELTYGG